MRNRWLSAVPAFALLVVLGLAGFPALAQTTGAIEGTVADSNGGPLPGVSVDIKSPALLGTRSVVTDASGRYKFPAIPPGVYTVSAALSGFTKAEKTNVRVALGGTATVRSPISVSIKEEVVVTGEAPVVDTTSTTVGIELLGDRRCDEAPARPQLRRRRRARSRVSRRTPARRRGGRSRSRSTARPRPRTCTSSTASTRQRHQAAIQGKAINNEFVQEVEVKTGGYQAEYGRNTGGVINVITKSGGNEFHGDVFGYYDSDSLTTNDKNVDATGTPSAWLPTPARPATTSAPTSAASS